MFPIPIPVPASPIVANPAPITDAALFVIYKYIYIKKIACVENTSQICIESTQ